MKKFTKFLLLLSITASQAKSQTCVLGYPDNSNLPRSQVAFNESDVLTNAQLDTSAGANHAVIKAWYTDEHALLLGIRKVIVKSSSGTTTTNYSITPTPSSPTCVFHPLVGSTVSSGDQVPNDVATGGGRPIFPALFVTDLTVNGANSRAGDWQQGGTPIPPTRVCGTWKGAVRTVDKTKNPVLVTITTDADPAKNGTNLGGGTPPPGGLVNEGYTAEIFWDVSELGLIPGHSYRYEFMVHDGDQNKSGGDAGENVFCSVMPGIPASLTLGNLVWLDINANNLKDATEPGIPNATVKLYADANNDNVADGAAIASTTTNSVGLYTFTGLAAGNYIVGVIIPANYQARLNGTIDPDNNIDNDNNGVNIIGINAPGNEVRSKAITLSQNAEPINDGDDNNGNETLDIGMCLIPAATTVSLGNLVWIDLNGNGIRDLSEPGVPGVTVNLYKDTNGDNMPDGGVIASTTTDNIGNYYFRNLSPDNYIVGAILPTGYYFISGNPLPNNDIDNDNNAVRQVGTEVRTNFMMLTPGTEPTTDGDDNNTNSTLDIAMLVVCPIAKGTVKNNETGTVVNTELADDLAVYPNPAINNFVLKINSKKQTISTVWITDQNGRTVSEKSLNVVSGSNIFPMNPNTKMPSGIYTVWSLTNGKKISKQLIIAK